MGAGGHAKVIIDMLDLMGTEILGLVTPDLKAVSYTHLTLPTIYSV